MRYAYIIPSLLSPEFACTTCSLERALVQPAKRVIKLSSHGSHSYSLDLEIPKLLISVLLLICTITLNGVWQFSQLIENAVFP